ncbi:MAG: hypothetical protein GX591_20530 [Planctomycetes bacterium]|nr:hypothetical protein [Planctomycetota bacterium]
MTDNAHIAVSVDGADQARSDLRALGEEGKRAGEGIAGGAGGAAEQTEKAGAAYERFLGQIRNAATSLVGLEAIRRAIVGISQAIEEAIRLKVQLNNLMAADNASVAGAAAQFGVSESGIRRLLADVGASAGVGREDLGGLAGLAVAASSAGLISTIGEGPAGGPATIADADRSTLTQMATFMQRTGTMPVGGDIAKLVNAIRQANPQLGVQDALGMIETTFKASQSSDWADFMSGATRGTLRMMAMGLDPQVAMSEYGAQATYAPSGAAAGETWRTVAERFVLSNDPKVIAEVESRFGRGAWWRMSMTQRHQAVMGTLLGQTGAAQDAILTRLDVQPEMRGRLAALQAGMGLAGDISARIAAGGSSAAADEAWLAGPRAIVQRGGQIAGEMQAAFGEGSPETAALVAILDAEATRAGVEQPALNWAMRAMSFASEERQVDLRRLLRRRLLDAGRGDLLDLVGRVGIGAGGSSIGWAPAMAPVDADAGRRGAFESAVEEILGMEGSGFVDFRLAGERRSGATIINNGGVVNVQAAGSGGRPDAGRTEGVD